MSAGEALGRAIGGALAPLMAELSLVRKARAFHPDGVVYRADVYALATDGSLGDLARALDGPAIVRFSNALRRARAGTDPRDVLGAAVRFQTAGGTDPGPRSQDLLFATFRHVWQTPIAALLTNARDFLANDYHTVSPFQIAGRASPVTFRLVPERHTSHGKDRFERLEHAVATGLATLRLDAREDERGARFVPVVSIDVREHVNLDQEALRFDPFRDGADITPVGLLQAVRLAAYPASQLGRAIARGPRARS